jgi:hypothetical protein
MSLSKSESARINGAKSRGPKTPEGKAASSQNSTKHGHFAKAIILRHESAERFEQLNADFMQRYQPRDAVELALVEQIVAATWRLSRCWLLQTETMNLEIEKDEGEDLENVTARSFQASVSASPAMQLLHRFENSYERIITRATRNLTNLRKNYPLPDDEPQKQENEPKPPSTAVAVKPKTSQSPNRPITRSLNDSILPPSPAPRVSS